MGFFDSVWAALNNPIAGVGIAVSSTSLFVMSTVQSQSAQSSDSLCFLDLPVEVRVMIYELSLGDIYAEPKFNNNHCYSRRSSARRQGFDIYFNVLLVNKQLNSEARSIFYRHHLRQLRQFRQIYYVCQTTKPSNTAHNALATPSPSPSASEWKWHLGVHSLWTCNCSSVKALADLQLPKIGLALWHPQQHRPSKKAERESEEQLAALKVFTEELAASLKGNNVRTSVAIHIDRKARRSPAKAIFHALAPLRESYEHVDISFMNHGARDLDDWMETELVRTTGVNWTAILSNCRLQWEMNRSLSERLRLRNIRDEIIKDLQLRYARGTQNLERL